MAQEEQPDQKEQGRQGVVAEGGNPAVDVPPQGHGHGQDDRVAHEKGGKKDGGSGALSVPHRQQGHEAGNGEHAAPHNRRFDKGRTAHDNREQVAHIPAVQHPAAPPVDPDVNAPLPVVDQAVVGGQAGQEPEAEDDQQDGKGPCAACFHNETSPVRNGPAPPLICGTADWSDTWAHR